MIRALGFTITLIVAVITFPVHSLGAAAQLYLSKDHVYSLAALSEDERAGLLKEIKSANPELSLSDLTREGSSVRLHNGSGDYMEIMSNELYSLAGYIPQGIESEISRRSGATFKVGRIVRESEGVRFYFGSAPVIDSGNLENILSASMKKKERPPPKTSIKSIPADPKLVDTSVTLKNIKTKETPQAPKVVSVDLTAKKSGVIPARRRSSSNTARLKEFMASQPRVASLTERVSDIGVVPRKLVKKKPQKPDRELTVVYLNGEVPLLDGHDGDDAWSTAPRSTFQVAGTNIRIEAAAVANGDNLFLLFSWTESAPSHRHRPWAWSEDSSRYERLDVLDDGVAVRWQMDAVPGKSRREFDLWIWRSGREGVGSHASDARLLIDDKPFFMASGWPQKGSVSWVRLDFDKGRLPFEIVLPSSFSGPEVASYAPRRPEGSASDVRGVGDWIGGKWVVEMSRALRTGHEDDIPFDQEGTCAFIVNLLQGKDLNESPASEVLTLRW